MARIRALKPGFFKNHDLFVAEKESGLPLRLAYEGLWCVADREGRFKWKPHEVKTDVLPYDDVDMSAVLDALVKYRFILRYKSAGEEYGFIPTFSEHQHVNKNEAPSTIPAPPKNSNARARPVSAQKPTVAAPSKHHEELVSGVWEQEGKGTELRDTSATADDPAQAVVIYNHVAEQLDWPIAELLTTKRRKALKARLVECGGLDGWFESMERASRSDFLAGRTARSDGHEKWMPDLDFFLQQQSFTKLMEGSYDNHRTAGGRGTVNDASDLALALLGQSGEREADHAGAERSGPTVPEWGEEGGPSDPPRNRLRGPNGKIH